MLTPLRAAARTSLALSKHPILSDFTEVMEKHIANWQRYFVQSYAEES